MNALVTPENIKQLMDGAKGATEVISKGSTTLVSETINLYIFYGVLGVLKAAVAFIIFGIVFKFLSSVDKMNETPSKAIKSYKTVALILSITYFTFMSMPHLQDIGKALVAPNIFVAEKGLELFNKKENK